MISVVVPLYNKEKQIVKTLQTVLNQTYTDFEVIVVDDGSTDDSVKEVKTIIDPRIRLIHQNNSGVSSARNQGIINAQGEYVAFLDADDEWSPDYLKTMYNLIKAYPDCGVFACSYYFKKGEVVKPAILRKMPFNTETGVLSNYFVVASSSNPPLWTSAVCGKLSAFREINGFPVGVKSGEDLLTWARLALKNKIAYNIKPYSYFVSTISEDQILRLPEANDIVGNQFALLYKDNHDVEGFRTYISLWHKMRSRIYLCKGYRYRSILDGMKSLKYDFNFKTIILILLNLLPTNAGRYIIKKISYNDK